MGLQDQLDRLRAQLRQALDAEDRAAVGEAIERLRMLQIVEHGLAAGDVLPDFGLQDPAGRLVTSDALLARGSLVVSFFRGGWCPYCSLTLQALDRMLRRSSAWVRASSRSRRSSPRSSPGSRPSGACG
jgi:hypothetical protein